MKSAETQEISSKKIKKNSYNSKPFSAFAEGGFLFKNTIQSLSFWIILQNYKKLFLYVD